MKRFLLTSLLLFSTLSFAGIDKECEANLIEATRSFIAGNSARWTGKKSSQVSLDFKSFKNVTPGSYDQRYQVEISMEWVAKNPAYPLGLDLILDFYSPFICDHLKLRGFIEQR